MGKCDICCPYAPIQQLSEHFEQELEIARVQHIINLHTKIISITHVYPACGLVKALLEAWIDFLLRDSYFPLPHLPNSKTSSVLMPSCIHLRGANL